MAEVQAMTPQELMKATTQRLDDLHDVQYLVVTGEKLRLLEDDEAPVVVAFNS